DHGVGQRPPISAHGPIVTVSTPPRGRLRIVPHHHVRGESGVPLGRIVADVYVPYVHGADRHVVFGAVRRVVLPVVTPGASVPVGVNVVPVSTHWAVPTAVVAILGVVHPVVPCVELTGVVSALPCPETLCFRVYHVAHVAQ